MRIARLATAVPLVCSAALLWLSDFVHDFGEADEIFGYLGVGIFLGGAFGLLAFFIRKSYIRFVLTFAPHLLFGLGYLTALSAMSR
ncbi:MAG: hypothetical protein AAGG48_32080 [Planctomycetota bacterium]